MTYPQRGISALAAGLVMFAFTACEEQPTAPRMQDLDGTPLQSAGHGGPKGSHDYQLNIIGVPQTKSADMTGDNGRRIFVPLEGRTRILLEEGPFQVLDANGTDGDARFQLPAPGVDAHLVGDPGEANVHTEYSVFIRPLGKPGGFATMTTCAELKENAFADLLPNNIQNVLNRRIDEDDAWCSIEQVGGDPLVTGDDRLYRSKGKSSFSNVTQELLTIVFEVEIEVEPGVIETFLVRAPLFDESLENEMWEYDNKGLKLAQVRFYDCSTNVDTGESTC